MGSITKQSSTDKPALEKEWANAEARLKLQQPDRDTWVSLGYTVRPYVYFDKILIVWDLVKGEPHIKDIFTVTALDGSLQGGLWLKLRSKVTNVETIVNHTPQRLADGLSIFAWLPYFNEVRYVSGDWNNPTAQRNLRLSACFKMVEDPSRSRLREGVHYLSELHAFREQFPQYRDTRF